MQSETLRNVRTLRQMKTGPQVTGKRRIRTTNSLSRTGEEVERLESLVDRQLEQVLEKERRRFAAQENSVNKSRRRVLRSRDKLAATINRNRALTELRHELQSSRWEKKYSSLSRAELPEQRSLHQMELKY